MEEKYRVLLRNNGNDVINIPSKIWEPLGWNLNDKLSIWVDECYNENNQALTTPDYFEIRLVRENDEDKYGYEPQRVEGTEI